MEEIPNLCFSVASVFDGDSLGSGALSCCLTQDSELNP